MHNYSTVELVLFMHWWSFTGNQHSCRKLEQKMP